MNPLDPSQRAVSAERVDALMAAKRKSKAKAKSKSNNPLGRPVGSGRGLSEATVLVTAPAVMLAAAALAAGAEGVSVREWWRRAGRVRLGWHEVAADVAE